LSARGDAQAKPTFTVLLRQTCLPRGNKRWVLAALLEAELREGTLSVAAAGSTALVSPTRKE
ncbi:MAG: hypothetical protein JRH20_23980, partial [Deltaproteobacteria bacterium]|nr:hypothetical protein [Deltaproteobacteria bacterium]